MPTLWIQAPVGTQSLDTGRGFDGIQLVLFSSKEKAERDLKLTISDAKRPGWVVLPVTVELERSE